MEDAVTDASPNLYLAAPIEADPQALARKLDAALAGGGVISLLLHLRGVDDIAAEAAIRAAAGVVQPQGVALVVDGWANLAPRAGADGAHILGAGDDLADAMKRLSPKYIVGAGALEMRDDAMRAGELGADYVLFGDESDDFEALIERVSWWAEIFNTPCVALARRLDDIAPLVAAGADFIMVEDCVWSDPRGPAAAIADAAGRVARASAEGSA